MQHASVYLCYDKIMKNMNPTSAAIAFHTTKVTNSLWGFFITGLIFEAAILSRVLPLLRRISIST